MADVEINMEVQELMMAGLMKDYYGNIVQIKKLIEDVASDLNEEVAKCILYADA